MHKIPNGRCALKKNTRINTQLVTLNLVLLSYRVSSRSATIVSLTPRPHHHTDAAWHPLVSLISALKCKRITSISLPISFYSFLVPFKIFYFVINQKRGKKKSDGFQSIIRGFIFVILDVS